MVSKCETGELFLTVEDRMNAGPNFIGVNVKDLYNFVLLKLLLFTSGVSVFLDVISGTGKTTEIEYLRHSSQKCAPMQDPDLTWTDLTITKTSLCNEDPLTPHFYDS